MARFAINSVNTIRIMQSAINGSQFKIIDFIKEKINLGGK